MKSIIIGQTYFSTDSNGKILHEISVHQDMTFNVKDAVSQNYDPEWIHYTPSLEWTNSNKRGYSPLKRGYPFYGI